MLTSYTIEVRKEGFHVTTQYGKHARYETTVKKFDEGITLLEAWYKEDCSENEEMNSRESALADYKRPLQGRVMLCPNPNTCEEKHNQSPGNSEHHYGCCCLDCLRFYLTLKG